MEKIFGVAAILLIIFGFFSCLNFMVETEARNRKEGEAKCAKSTCPAPSRPVYLVFSEERDVCVCMPPEATP